MYFSSSFFVCGNGNDPRISRTWDPSPDSMCKSVSLCVRAKRTHIIPSFPLISVEYRNELYRARVCVYTRLLNRSVVGLYQSLMSNMNSYFCRCECNDTHNEYHSNISVIILKWILYHMPAPIVRKWRSERFWSLNTYSL